MDSQASLVTVANVPFLVYKITELCFPRFTYPHPVFLINNFVARFATVLEVF